MDAKIVKDFAEKSIKNLRECLNLAADKPWMKDRESEFKGKIEAYEEILKFIEDAEKQV